MEQTSETLLLRRSPDRSWWNWLVLPVMIFVLSQADYNLNGQGPAARIIGKYMVPVLLAGLAVVILFRWETVRVDGEALTIESAILGWRRSRRIPLVEIERLEFDAGMAGSDGASSCVRLKRTGHTLMIHFAKDISERQACAFLAAAQAGRMPDNAT